MGYYYMCMMVTLWVMNGKIGFRSQWMWTKNEKLYGRMIIIWPAVSSHVQQRSVIFKGLQTELWKILGDKGHRSSRTLSLNVYHLQLIQLFIILQPPFLTPKVLKKLQSLSLMSEWHFFSVSLGNNKCYSVNLFI